MRKLANIGVVVGALMTATMFAAADDSPVVSGTRASEVTTLRQRASADYEDVLRLKTTATREKDIIRVNCLNDKLVQMKPQLNILDTVSERLAVEPDQQAADRTFAELVSTANSIREQRELASQCINAEKVTNETQNTFDAPEGLDNPTDPDPDSRGYIEPPAYASPDR